MQPSWPDCVPSRPGRAVAPECRSREVSRTRLPDSIARIKRYHIHSDLQEIVRFRACGRLREKKLPEGPSAIATLRNRLLLNMRISVRDRQSVCLWYGGRSQELRIEAGEAVSATGNAWRLSEEKGDSQRGICAIMSGLTRALGRSSVDDWWGEAFASRNGTNGYGPLAYEQTGARSGGLDRGHAAQSGARIGGGVLDTQARH